MKQDRCEYCDDFLKEQKVRVDHWWKNKLFRIKNVPAKVCSGCGERYYEARVLRQLDRIARSKVGSVHHMKILISDYQRIHAAA